MIDELCPNCGCLIRVKTTGIGQYITCPACQEIFRLASLNPPVLERVVIAWSRENERSPRRERTGKVRAHPPQRDFEEDDEDFRFTKRGRKSQERGYRDRN